MRLNGNMIKLITLYNDCRDCGRSQVIVAVITDHHISQNSLMVILLPGKTVQAKGLHMVTI